MMSGQEQPRDATGKAFLKMFRSRHKVVHATKAGHASRVPHSGAGEDSEVCISISTSEPLPSALARLCCIISSICSCNTCAAGCGEYRQRRPVHLSERVPSKLGLRIRCACCGTHACLLQHSHKPAAAGKGEQVAAMSIWAFLRASSQAPASSRVIGMEWGAAPCKVISTHLIQWLKVQEPSREAC